MGWDPIPQHRECWKKAQFGGESLISVLDTLKLRCLGDTQVSQVAMWMWKLMEAQDGDSKLGVLKMVIDIVEMDAVV